MSEALDKWEGGICVVGRMVTNLRYADDTILIARSKEDTIEIMERKENKRESRPISRLNVLKTKVVTTGDIEQVTVDGEIVEVVTSFRFLRALLTRDRLC